MHDWFYGNKSGDVVSMGIISDGNPYGVAEGLMFSFPVECAGGQWRIVKGLKLDEFSKQKLKETEAELLEERKMALGI
jgi:malate/lactate dehydrogenase